MSNELQPTGKNELDKSRENKGLGFLNVVLKPIKTKKKLAVLVLDGSGSMTHPGDSGQSKAAEVSDAVAGFLKRLKHSKHYHEYYISVVCFDDRQITKINHAELAILQLESLNFDPTLGLKGRTRIDLAITAAINNAEAFVNQQSGIHDLPHSAVVLLMSDGYCDVASTTLQSMAGYANPTVKIATVFYGELSEENKGALKFMEDLASKDEKGHTLATHVKDADQLKTWFFDKTITTF